MGYRRDPNLRACWSAERLRNWVAATCGGDSIVLLANREPYRHDVTPDGSIVVHRSSGGLVTALEPVMQACSGVWVAHGSGSADRLVIDGRDGLDVPPANPSYRLRRVWLDPLEERGYYYGFANEGLWPLCHRTHVKPMFRASDFNTYRSVNGRFVDAVCEELTTDQPLVLVQDYHFALAPQMIRERLPNAGIVAFWHIPWPSPGDYTVCPWRRELLEGLLGSTIVGFQTPDDCEHFLDSAEYLLSADVDRTRGIIAHDDVQTMVRDYPVSVEFPSRTACQSPSVSACRSAIHRQLGLPLDVAVGVGIDRLDYTKGVNEKFLAVERLLETNPEFLRQFVFVQVADPSRGTLPAYRKIRSTLRATAERINARFGADGYRPIVLLEVHHEPADVYRLLRGADVCYVGSLHDGMNLVAKEFVAARDDERGVLILSKFAGASRELASALIVDPYATDEGARALARALRMPEEEQASRMRSMRSVVARFSTFRWAGEMLADVRALSFGSPQSAWPSAPNVYA